MFFKRPRPRLTLGPAEETALVRVRGVLATSAPVTSGLSGDVAAAFRYVLGIARPFPTASSKVIVDELGFVPLLGGWLGREAILEVEGKRLLVPLGRVELLSPFLGKTQVLHATLLPAELAALWRERTPRDGVVHFAEHALAVGAQVQLEATVERARGDGYRGVASVHHEDFRVVATKRAMLWVLDPP